MFDFFTTFANTDLQAFPATKAVNSSGGQATDGTEFVANLVNDLWGYMQGLLSISAQTPSGLAEAYDNSQLIKAHQRFTIPGMIIPVAWNDTPLNLGIRALPLVGQGILRANYPDLDEVVYVGDADNPTKDFFYHADDSLGAARNTAGVYLILPDGRGRVIRGLDLTGSVDPDGTGRDLGSYQGSAMWGHAIQHVFGNRNLGTSINIDMQSVGFTPGAGDGLGVSQSISDPTNTIYGKIIGDGVNPTPDISSESRTINLALDHIITY